MVEFLISENDGNQRLDKFLKKYLKNAPLSHIYKLIRKDVKVNGKRQKPETVLHPGDQLILFISEEDEQAFKSIKAVSKQKRQFEIAHEDENLIIVSKPFGLLTHGDAFEKKNTLVNQVMGYLIENGGYDPSEKAFSPAPVNRLDRNTTGLVIFGKNSVALKTLNLMIGERNHIRKYYKTIVAGEIKKDLTLKGKLEKDTIENKVSILDEDGSVGKEIETVVRVVDKAKGFTLVEVELITGRTHQIRAHLAHAGYPIIGDTKYGNKRLNWEINKKYDLTTQILHAERLYFDHMMPYFDYMAGLEVKAQLPKEFSRIKDAIFV